MSKYLTKQLLLSGNYWVLNKDVVRLVGLETAFLLTCFAEAETMLADKEGWFYQTIERTEEITGLKRSRQDKATRKLVELGILEQINKGLPMKRYFRINYKVLKELWKN